jgi:hypothetical protein
MGREKVNYSVTLDNKIFSKLTGDLLCTTQKTGTSGSNETNLLTRGGITRDSRGVTNVLMVTTTVGVINRVHGNTTSLWPAVSLESVLVEGATSLEQGLINTTTAGNDTNRSTALVVEHLLGTRGKLDTGLAIFGVVSDNGGVVTRSTGKSTTITNLFFNVADNGTFGHGANVHDVTDGKGSC